MRRSGALSNFQTTSISSLLSLKCPTASPPCARSSSFRSERVTSSLPRSARGPRARRRRRVRRTSWRRRRSRSAFSRNSTTAPLTSAPRPPKAATGHLSLPTTSRPAQICRPAPIRFLIRRATPAATPRPAPISSARYCCQAPPDLSRRNQQLAWRPTARARTNSSPIIRTYQTNHFATTRSPSSQKARCAPPSGTSATATPPPTE